MAARMEVHSLLLAGGRGERLPGVFPKQLQEIGGRPLLQYALNTFCKHPQVSSVILVMNKEYFAWTEKWLREDARWDSVRMVCGGETRQESSAAGIGAIEDEEGLVLIHDVARPLVSASLISACLLALERSAAVVPALALRDTPYLLIESFEAKGGDLPLIGEPLLEHGRYRLAQTPQGFHLPIIRQAHDLAKRQGRSNFTDDGTMVHHFGLAPVTIIPGESTNIKITLPEDIPLAESLLWQR